MTNTIENYFDCIDNQDGALTFVRLDADIDQAKLRGICGSSEDIHDFHNECPKEFPKGKYLVLRAVDIVEI